MGFCLLLAACSKGGGGSSDIGFQLINISVDPNEPWHVNREIVFTFSKDVKFSSVSLNTISIQTTTGTPATGTFRQDSTNKRRIIFQPTCPTRADFADTGLIPGGLSYVIRVLGESSGASNTVQSMEDDPLAITQSRSFITREADDAFLDTVLGPPDTVQGDGNTHLEWRGGNLFFDEDGMPLDSLFESPLNLYGDPGERVAWVLEFNQAVDPTDTNISQDRLRLEFLEGLTWRALETTVTLEANCTETGARVRLTPIGEVGS